MEPTVSDKDARAKRYTESSKTFPLAVILIAKCDEKDQV
jgi:hypothetical protein